MSDIPLCPMCGEPLRDCKQKPCPGPSSITPSDKELDNWLRMEISGSMETAHIAHQLENEWSSEMNLLISRIMGQFRASKAKAAKAELEGVKVWFDGSNAGKSTEKHFGHRVEYKGIEFTGAEVAAVIDARIAVQDTIIKEESHE